LKRLLIHAISFDSILEEAMGQILIRNVPDTTLDVFRQRAKLKGHSLEQEIRDLLEANRPFTREERVAASRAARARYKGVQPSLTLDEVREGLE
jgi:plasmid stability protein